MGEGLEPVEPVGDAPVEHLAAGDDHGAFQRPVGEDLQNPVFFLFVEFDSQPRRDRQENNQIGGMGFMYFKTSSEQTLSEKMEAFKKCSKKPV